MCCFSHSHFDIHRLKSTATLSEILEAMRNTVSGVGFLTHHPSLPSYTFVSADAVQWLICHVDGVLHEERAVDIMEVSVCPNCSYLFIITSRNSYSDAYPTSSSQVFLKKKHSRTTKIYKCLNQPTVLISIT